MKNLFTILIVLLATLAVKMNTAAQIKAQDSHGVVTLTDMSLLPNANPADKSIIFVIAVAGSDKQRAYKWVPGAVPTTPAAKVSYMTYNKLWIPSNKANGYWAIANMEIMADNVLKLDSMINTFGYSKIAQVQSDWNATTSPAAILNKPALFTQTLADARYKPIGYTPSSTEISTALGYAPYNGISNPNGYISSVPVTSVYGRTGAITAATGDYNTSQVTENTNLYYTPARFNTAFAAKVTDGLAEGTTNKYYTDARTRSALSGTNGIAYDNTTGAISQITPTYNNVPGRALTTSFRPSLTRPTRVSYTVSIATTLSLLNLNSSGTIALQISVDGTTWITINSAGITRTLAVSISVGLNDTSLLNVSGEVPTGYYVRLLPTTTGGGTVTMSSGQEVVY